MSDTNSFIYRYHWDQEDLVDYPWPEHYVKQPEVERYLHHVVERHDLRKHFSFNTEMRSADFDESQNVWKLTTRHGDKPGETLTARFVVSALGLLSKRTLPDYPGIETFKGEMVCKPTSTVDWLFETHGRHSGSRLGRENLLPISASMSESFANVFGPCFSTIQATSRVTGTPKANVLVSLAAAQLAFKSSRRLASPAG